MRDDPDRKAATAEAFGERAERYRESAMHRTGEDLDRLAAWCAGTERALDVATGAGHTARALRAVDVPTVVATDASPARVATAVAGAPGLCGVVGDAERLPFRAGAFDAVTCRIAAHHFPDPRAFVAEVARVLAPGGTLAFEDNVAPEDDDVARFLDRLERLHDPSHVRSHPVADWEAWLAEAGLDVAERVRCSKPLSFAQWVDGLPDAASGNGPRLRRLLLEAPAAVGAALDVQTEGATVRSFAPPKVLIRAVRAR